MTRKLSRELWDTLKAVSLVIGSHEMYDETHPTRIAGYAHETITIRDGKIA